MIAAFVFSPPQLRNEVLPLELSAVQRLESFRLLEDNGRALSLSPDTLSHQRLKQKLLVSSLCGREIKACWCWAGLGQSGAVEDRCGGFFFQQLRLVFMFLSLLQIVNFWTMNYSSSSCWYKSEMSHVRFFLCSFRIIIEINWGQIGSSVSHRILRLWCGQGESGRQRF